MFTLRQLISSRFQSSRVCNWRAGNENGHDKRCFSCGHACAHPYACHDELDWVLRFCNLQGGKGCGWPREMGTSERHFRLTVRIGLRQVFEHLKQYMAIKVSPPWLNVVVGIVAVLLVDRIPLILSYEDPNTRKKRQRRAALQSCKIAISWDAWDTWQAWDRWGGKADR